MKRCTRTILLAGLAALATTLAACGGSSSTSTPTPPATPPAAPTGLTATAANGSVTLSWAASSGATSYKVYRATATGALSAKSVVATITSGTGCVDAASNGTMYYYQVTAVNSAGESGGSNEASAMPTGSMKPLAPTGVAAAPALSQVTVTWNDVPGAASYNVYYGTSHVTTSSSVITGATSPTVINSLNNGTVYYFAVTAVASGQESLLSAEVSATPNMALPYIEATVLRWAGTVAQNAPVAQVRVCTESTCHTNVTDATVTVNSTPLPWVTGRGEYEAAPAIAAGAGVSVSVVVPSGSNAAAGTYTATGTMYTAAPTVTAPTSTTIWDAAVDNTVTWNPGAPTSTTPASEYVVGVQDAAGNFYPTVAVGAVSTAPITASSFVVPAGSLPAAGPYTVFVGIGTQGIVANAGGGIAFAAAATNSSLYLGSCSALTSFTVTAPVPPAPTGLTATAGSGHVSLSWSASLGATSYKVYRGSAAGGLGTKSVINTVSSGTAFNDTSVTDGSTYYYQVVASNVNGDSPGSAQVSATPGPLPYIDAQVIHWASMPPTGFPIRVVRICTDSTCGTSVGGVPGFAVSVNSGNLTWNAGKARYESSAMVAEGAAVDLAVTVPTGQSVASGTFTASGTMYTQGPTITAPSNLASWNKANANTVTWTAGAPTATPWTSIYVVGIIDGTGTFYPTNTNNSPLDVSISTLSYVLPANSITVAGAYSVFVGIGAAGLTSGTPGVGAPVTGAATGSGLHLGDVTSMVTVTVN